MSLIPANIEYLGFAIQSDKDTPATDPVICVSLEDCQLDPGVQTQPQQESDRSAQQGNKAVVGAEPGGTFKKYVRPSEEDFFLYALLGKNVDSGSTPKVHTANVDDTAPFSSPYLTVWDVWPGVATIRYDGVRIGKGSYVAQPGGFWEVEYTLVGRKATFGEAEPDPSGLFVDELAHVWPELTATLNGSHSGTVNGCTLNIGRNTGRFPGDNGYTSFDVPNGLVSFDGSIEIAFQDDDLMRAANTGTTSGTVVTSTLYEQALNIALARGANLGVAFDMNAIQMSNFKTALKTDGSPAVSSFDFNSKRQAALADAMQTIVKNALTHADRS